MTEIIGFHSYKGGSGKTSLAINFANQLANSFNKKVILIEADFSMPSFSHIFNNLDPDLFLNNFVNKECAFNDMIYTYDTFDVIFNDPNAKLSTEVFKGDYFSFLDIKDRIIEGLEKLSYDFVIFDLAPGLHYFSGAIFTEVTHLFGLMRTDTHSYQGTNFLLRKIYDRLMNETKGNFHLIFNQIPKIEEMKDLINRWKIELEANHQFISNFLEFDYNPYVNYFSSLGKIILPEEDPTSQKIKGSIKEILLVE